LVISRLTNTSMSTFLFFWEISVKGEVELNHTKKRRPSSDSEERQNHLISLRLDPPFLPLNFEPRSSKGGGTGRGERGSVEWEGNQQARPWGDINLSDPKLSPYPYIEVRGNMYLFRDKRGGLARYAIKFRPRCGEGEEGKNHVAALHGSIGSKKEGIE